MARRALPSLRRILLAAGRSIRPLRIRGIPRVLFKTAPLFVGRGLGTVESVSGVKLALDVTEYASCMMFYGRYAAEIIALLERIVRPGDSVLDIGAQLGYVSAHLARIVGPRGAVHSFEPDPRALSRLRETIGANGFGWVKVFPVAAGDRAGALTLNVSPTLGWSTAVSGSHLQDLVPVEVACARIDDLAERGEIRRPVRVVKIDVEGFEVAVLDGMQALLATDRPCLILEVNPTLLAPSGHSPRDLLARVVKHGYRVYRIREPAGVLGGGRVELCAVDVDGAGDSIGFCDVLCVPAEMRLPADLEPRARGGSLETKR